MFIFLVLSFVTCIVGVADIMFNGFSLSTLFVVVLSMFLSYFFYKLIQDEDSDWGCD